MSPIARRNYESQEAELLTVERLLRESLPEALKLPSAHQFRLVARFEKQASKLNTGSASPLISCKPA